MNYVWPNIFETSPHMMQSFNDAVEGFRVSVGPGRVLLYTLQVSGCDWECGLGVDRGMAKCGVPQAAGEWVELGVGIY